MSESIIILFKHLVKINRGLLNVYVSKQKKKNQVRYKLFSQILNFLVRYVALILRLRLTKNIINLKCEIFMSINNFHLNHIYLQVIIITFILIAFSIINIELLLLNLLINKI